MRYSIAFAVTGATTLLRLSLDPLWDSKLPFSLFYLAIMISAWLGGLGPGLVTTSLSAAAVAYFWIEPYRSLWVKNTADLSGLMVFLFIGVLISVLNEAWRLSTRTISQSEERLRVTLESIGDAVITTDNRGKVTHLNDIAQALIGWAESDATGSAIEDVFVTLDEQTRDRVEGPAWKILRGEILSGSADHSLLLTKDGGNIPIDLSAATIKTVDGQIAGAVIVFRDVTVRRVVERELAALHEKERQARRAAEAAEQQLHVALDAGRMGTWRWSMATGEVKWSTGLEAIHGLAPGTFPGTFEAVKNEIHPQDRERVLSSIGMALESGEDLHVVYRIIRTDGSLRWVEGRGQILRDIDGRPEGLMGVCSDITERRQSEEKFRLAVEAAPAAMIMIDQRGVILLANELMERLAGYARTELLGMPIENLVPSRLRERHAIDRTHFFADAQQRPMGAGRELYVLHKDGTEVAVEIGLSPIRTTDGVFVIAAVSDITERKRLAEAERKAKRDAEEANLAKDEFLAMLSHELRTPLSAILGWTAILRSKELPVAQSSHALEVIERNARVEAQLVESLLDISRITAGKLKLALEPVDLAFIVRSTVDSLRPNANTKAVALDMSGPEDPLIVIGDSGRLQQVFSNLIANAIKFTPRDGHVHVHLMRTGSHAEVRIVDDGEGISPDFLPRIFDRFRQADSATARTYGGLGLGLAIVRELVHAHGGSITASSPGKGHGSTFTVSFAVPAVVPAAAGITTPPTEDEQPSISRLRVLVVDDDGDARELVAITLKSHGALPLQAASARQALEYIDREQPDVLLADIGMPQEDGYALIQRVRIADRSRQKRLPAIALTAFASANDREQALAAGYDMHLSKPVHQRDLTRAIAKVFNEPK
jgi:PAS domain S-box-containing protein